MRKTNVTRGKKGFQPTVPIPCLTPEPSDLPTGIAIDVENEESKNLDNVTNMHREVLLKRAKIVVSERKEFKRTNYSGFLLKNPVETIELLANQGVYPVYERVILEHVTHKFPDKKPAPVAAQVFIVGHVSDGEGVQALIVSVDGSTERSDNGTYHVTYTLGEGRRPVESNNVIKTHQSILLETPIRLETEPF